MSDSYVEGLKYELSGARLSGDKDHEKAILAELKRAGSPQAERAVAPKVTETRKKG